MKRIIIISGIIVIAVAISVGVYLFNKTEKDIKGVEPDFMLSASELFESFSSDEAAASVKYIGNVLEVTGPFSGIQTNDRNINTIFLLDDFMGISCLMDSIYSDEVLSIGNSLVIGDTVTIRGICNGYLTDVQLSSCVFPDMD